MSKEQGSREISLGPYRSTELALEERLTKEESCKIVQLIQEENLVRTKCHDFSKKETAQMLLALGYQEKKPRLFARHDGKFVYTTERYFNFNETLVSGYIEGNLENILSDMQLIENMGKYSEKLMENVKSNNFSMALGLSSLAISIPILFTVNTPLVGTVTSLICSIVSGVMSGRLIAAYADRRSSKNLILLMQKGAFNLSKNASNYQFGKTVYDKILSEYHRLSMSSINAPKLETSESKQLPQEKKWAENQIGPETFVVSEATRRHFEKPESERGLETAPAFKDPAKIEVLKK